MRNRQPRPWCVGGALVIAVLGRPACALAQDELDNDEDPADIESFAELSLEELMNISVTSLSGVKEDWFTTPAAMYVITGEDIRRSGHRSIPDALRLAPGVFVGHTNASNWSVGMRGFNGSLANKTLIVIDGRAVYDPLFGGTYWTVQDVLLEDVDRIEVIRGPGPTLWGANAVNGVVNVTTKSAKDTVGTYIEGGAGTHERGFGSVRHGIKLGETSWLRAYAKWTSRDDFVDASGNSLHDDWDMLRAGFRYDREGNTNITFQGDIYHSDTIGEFNPAAPVPGQNIVFISDVRDVRASGGNLVFRIGQEEKDHGWTFQTYADHRERMTNIEFQVNRSTFDADWRHHFKLGKSHEIMWGLGGRFIREDTEDGYQLVHDPQDRTLHTVSAFVQDTITLVPDRLFAMIGSKFEHNNYTGIEAQPSARAWWTPNDKHTLWASVSRAVRIPSRSEYEGRIIFGYVDTGVLGGGPPSGEIIALGTSGNPDLEPEELIAYELGHRVRITDDLSLDTALFYNVYERLIYVPSVIEPFNNHGTGEAYGGELAATWRVAPNWTLRGSYSYVDVQIHGPIADADEDNTPHQLFKLQSNLDITEHLELNGGLSFTDGVGADLVDDYWRLDLGVTWRPTANTEFAVWGQNLLEERHREFSTSQVSRSLYFMGSVRF